MTFTVEAFHNPYLSPGTARVDAVITVTAAQDGEEESAGAAAGNSVFGLVVDVSGSMQGARVEAVRHATRRAIALLPEESHFFVARFSNQADMLFPLAPATPENKARADDAVRRLTAGGGTCMSLGLELARAEFAKVPGAIRQALFLTDGKNDPSDERRLDEILAACEGVFQCDCRGVGTDWQVKQLQKIAGQLLGTAQIIAEPAGMEADFTATIRKAAARAVGEVRLRIWTPRNVRVVTVKQMNPEIAVLTDRGTPADVPQAIDYPTGAWARAESRDYYLAAEMSAPGTAGEEMLAARASIVFSQGGQTQEVKSPAGRVLVAWTEDEALSARISPEVAHYTGQEELAQAIQEGLEARAQGNLEAATMLLGKAARLAHESGNDETTMRLKKVVEIVDADEGTVRLKQSVNKADEMDLDLGSTRTARVRRPGPAQQA
jgi:hypothetical protein